MTKLMSLYGTLRTRLKIGTLVSLLETLPIGSNAVSRFSAYGVDVNMGELFWLAFLEAPYLVINRYGWLCSF